jgi:hypothetical protein
MNGFGVDKQLFHFEVHLSQGPNILRPSGHKPKRASLIVTRTEGQGTKHQGTKRILTGPRAREDIVEQKVKIKRWLVSSLAVSRRKCELVSV